MYTAHFGLKENPFNPLSDSAVIFPSKELVEAVSHFLFARETGEVFFLLTGEVGTGKTTAIRAIQHELPSDVPVVRVSHATLTPDDLYDELALRFGVREEGDTTRFLRARRLESVLAQHCEQGRVPALFFDEAHLLRDAVLEEVRLLSNLRFQGRPVIQICLVGQPELLNRLRRDALRPLRQRITIRYAIGPLSRDETRAYIAERLRAAGAKSPDAIFHPRAADTLYSITGGVPREVNVLAGQAMLNAYVEDAPMVTRAHVLALKSHFGFEGIRAPRGGAPRNAPQAPAAPVRSSPPPSPPAPRREDVSKEAPPPAVRGEQIGRSAGRSVGWVAVLGALALLLSILLWWGAGEQHELPPERVVPVESEERPMLAEEAGIVPEDAEEAETGHEPEPPPTQPPPDPPGRPEPPAASAPPAGGASSAPAESPPDRSVRSVSPTEPAPTRSASTQNRPPAAPASAAQSEPPAEPPPPSRRSGSRRSIGEIYPGALAIESDTPAVVWLGDDRIGTAPGTFSSLPPGRYPLKLETDAGRVIEREVIVTAGSTTYVRFQSRPRPAAAPAGSEQGAPEDGAGASSGPAGDVVPEPTRALKLWSGFLTDEDCGVRGGQEGPTHLRCAEHCIRNGSTPLLYTQGQLYRIDGIDRVVLRKGEPISFTAWLEPEGRILHVVTESRVADPD